VVGPVTGTESFAVHVDLGTIPASLDDVLVEIGNRLDGYAPKLSQQKAALELALTVEATDLWLAVLLAMAAVTSTGYRVIRLDARPLDQRSA
jgi:hypothetical protein